MPTSLSRANLRHVGAILRQGRNPASVVYESLGPDFFLSLDDGWLNLGLWEGDGSDPSEAPVAVRRLVRELALVLPTNGVILDVGNGLGAQDPLISEIAAPRRLIALNITRSQLEAGRARLAEARADPLVADATRIPLMDASVDGIISVEAAFHFSSRERFFREAFRVLRPGGVLTMSDVPMKRLPLRPSEVLAAVTQMRVWGLRPGAAASVDRIVGLAEAAGFRGTDARDVGPRVIAPALRCIRARLDDPPEGVATSQIVVSRVMLAQAELLWRQGVIGYLLLSAWKPAR